MNEELKAYASELVADGALSGTIRTDELTALLSRLEQAERELVAVKSTQVQHIVKTSFETARTAGIALDEAVKVVAGWLVNDPDRRAREAEQQVARVRGAVGKLRKAVEDIQTDDPGLESYSHNRSRGAGYQIASSLVDRALDGES